MRVSLVFVADVACTTCSNGLLVFLVGDDDGRVFLECEECMSTCAGIDDAGEATGRTGFSFDDDAPVSPATKAQIRSCGWHRWVRGEPPQRPAAGPIGTV